MAEFVGLSNVVPVELVETRQDGTVVKVFGRTVRSRRPPRDPAGSLAMVLRPEALQITRAEQGGVPARVRTLSYIGPIARYRVVVEMDGTELIIDQSNPGPDEFYPEGTAVWVKLPAEVPSLLSQPG